MARLLNERGYRTRSGAKFSDTTVARLIQDPTAKGIRRANYTRTPGEGKSWKLKPESEWVLSPIEAIIPEELWTRCNALLEERKRNGKAPGRKPVHLFTGVAFCECGQKLYVPSNTPKYVCYTCRNKIPTADLEAIFHEQLREFFLSPDEITKYLSEADETLKAKEETLAALHTERDKITQTMDRVTRAYTNDEIPVQAYGRQYRPLDERFNQIEEELPRLQAEVDFIKVRLLSSDQILTEARDLYSRWPTLAPDEKRQIIEAIVEQVVVGKGDVAIHLCYVPSASETAVDKQRGVIPALPFCQFTLQGVRTDQVPVGYPEHPRTLGEHVRKRRMDLGLTQVEAGAAIGVDLKTVYCWERGRTQPATRFLPGILGFLGEDPRPRPKGLPARLRASREALGLSQRELAAKLGVDPTTDWHWENGITEPPVRSWPTILQLVGASQVQADASIGERIRTYRRAHGLTQAELAKRLGVKQQAVSDWERGRRALPKQIGRTLQLA